RAESGHEGNILIGAAAATAKVGQAEAIDGVLEIAIAARRAGGIWTPLQHAMRIDRAGEDIAAVNARSRIVARRRGRRAEERVDILHRIGDSHRSVAGE